MSTTVQDIKVSIQKNKKRLAKELRESKELVVLLKKSTHDTLSDEEKGKVKEQLLDICKGIPAFASDTLNLTNSATSSFIFDSNISASSNFPAFLKD